MRTITRLTLTGGTVTAITLPESRLAAEHGGQLRLYPYPKPLDIVTWTTWYCPTLLMAVSLTPC
jgi:hypothetical protein